MAKFEAALLSLYLSPCRTEEEFIRLSFIIGGATHVFICGEHDYDTVSRVLTDLLKLFPADTRPAA